MNNKLNKNIITVYRKNGWVIVKNFFKKKDIKTVKAQILKKVLKSKDNGHFYFEKIKNK